MGLLDDAMDQQKLLAKNSAMALEAGLRSADEAKTANLIALYATMDGYGSNHSQEQKYNLLVQIRDRLGLQPDCKPKEDG